MCLLNFFVSAHRLCLSKSSLTILIETLVLSLSRIVHRARSLRTETLAVALAGVDRFQFRLLSGRHEMRVFFQILDDFFRDYFTLKTAQRIFD